MQTPIERCIAQVNEIVLGKQRIVRLAVVCLLARGHLLLEDLPGMGKTTLSHALAQVMGLKFQRVQFTSDLLPGDILGTSIFDPNRGEFKFHPGPVFSELLLADEINRATPKSQSALLEAMEEGQVSLDGITRPLPDPFFVIATQNPTNQSGTFPLPESQLDRFLMRLSLGYPSPEAELELLMGGSRRTALDKLEPIVSHAQLRDIQQHVANIRVTESLARYIWRLVDTTRRSPDFEQGISPRGALALLTAAKAWAFLERRDYVIPEDVQSVAPAVLLHRLQGQEWRSESAQVEQLARLISCVAVLE